jgi:integrase
MALFQRDGSWFIGYPLGNGKYRRERVGASHALAKDLYAKRLAEIAERRFFPARATISIKFDEIAERYWDLHGKHLAGSWAFMLGKIRHKFGQMKAGEIGPAEVQRYLDEIAAKTSDATANHYLTLLKSIYTKARQFGVFHGENPCAMLKKRPKANHRLRFLSKEEMKTLLAGAHPRLYPFLVAAICTGMRKGELLSLRWENVSLERATIYILKAKSGKPREIPITDGLSRVLGALGPKAEGSVFNLPDITARRYFEQARRAAKLPARGQDKVTLHTLRHSFASHFIMETRDLPTLQRLLGHSTPLLTMIYAHLSREHLAAGMARFEAGMPAMDSGGVLTAPQLLVGPQGARGALTVPSASPMP